MRFLHVTVRSNLSGCLQAWPPEVFGGSPKCIRRVPLTGPALCSLLERYVAALAEGKYPKIISCWSAVQHEETSRVRAERVDERLVMCTKVAFNEF